MSLHKGRDGPAKEERCQGNSFAATSPASDQPPRKSEMAYFDGITSDYGSQIPGIARRSVGEGLKSRDARRKSGSACPVEMPETPCLAVHQKFDLGDALIADNSSYSRLHDKVTDLSLSSSVELDPRTAVICNHTACPGGGMDGSCDPEKHDEVIAAHLPAGATLLWDTGQERQEGFRVRLRIQGSEDGSQRASLLKVMLFGGVLSSSVEQSSDHA